MDRLRFLRPLITATVIVAVWQLGVVIFEPPAYILPSPAAVLATLIGELPLLIHHAAITALEILLGILIGTAIGVGSALFIQFWQPARRWMLPLLVVSQALPVFALAPLLMLWFGYGMASKIAMAALIIYFPVTASVYDGLRRTPQGWIDLARTMNAGKRARLLLIQLPAALPSFASGLKIAAAIAPIGAVVGEWVGASRGLGFLMLHANGRMQIDLLFAALLVLALMGLALYYSIDSLSQRFIHWT